MSVQINEKVANIIKRIINKDLQDKPELENGISEITLTPYSFSENMPKAMVISIPLDLLRYVKIYYKDFLSAVKKELPGYMILTVRTGEIAPKNKLNPVRAREQILSDVVFPARILGRTQDIQSREVAIQNVYLDNNQQYWSQSEVATLQKVVSKILDDKFIIGMFTSN